MNEKDTVKKGFNAGYMMQKRRPILAEQLAQGCKTTSHPFVLGFLSGRKQCLREKINEASQYISSLRDHKERTRSPRSNDLDVNR